MRDLASRLRAIVSGTRGRTEVSSLTYEPELGGAGVGDLETVAATLGGTCQRDGAGAYVVVERVWDADRWHGRRRIDSYVIDPVAPISLFDPRLANRADWASRVVFFDIETTGLSGGAGTLAFLAGCGWFADGGFHVRQFFLGGPGGESAMLDGLASLFDEASLLVTFNGRTFDVPVMEMRWAFHRKPSPTDALPHFDMLPSARRLWGRRGREIGAPAEASGCNLSALERAVLGLHRLADVPGFEIPARYFQFLRTGQAALVEDVLEHNRHDLFSLAMLTAHALHLASDGPEACREPSEQVALGRLYDRAGDNARAARAYELAASSGEPDVRAHALARLALLLRREARHDESAAAWQGVFDLASSESGPCPLAPLERRAAEALAIHHEHRAHDLEAAKRYAEVVRGQASGRLATEVAHRLSRLDRKIRAAERAKAGPEAAPLLPS